MLIIINCRGWSIVHEEESIQILFKIHIVNDVKWNEMMMVCKYRLGENKRKITKFNDSNVVATAIQEILAKNIHDQSYKGFVRLYVLVQDDVPGNRYALQLSMNFV